MAKKVPLRQCAGCREKKPKMDLLRVIRTPEGQVVLDTVGRKNGRGVYICPDRACLNKARKSRALPRSLKAEIPEEVYQKLEEELIRFETKG